MEGGKKCLSYTRTLRTPLRTNEQHTNNKLSQESLCEKIPGQAGVWFRLVYLPGPGSSVGRALAQHARGPGFKSPLGQGFFSHKDSWLSLLFVYCSYVLNVLVCDGLVVRATQHFFFHWCNNHHFWHFTISLQT